ncbi:hypothetical protein [Yoonia sp. SS1-5]|uniref:Lipoprotein n=1 Tax=Yoonia rhodophyticola TaxID=3137370 RepID=A0AAN0MKE7_9RHOB
MKRHLVTALAFAGLAACAVDPQAVTERRADLMERLFPDPTDREGLYLVFPIRTGGLNRTLLITHYVDTVSREEVLRRVARYCAGLGSAELTGEARLVKDLGPRKFSQPGGGTRTGFRGRYTCVSA